MNYYILINNKKIKCLRYSDKLIVLLEHAGDWGIINNKWVLIQEESISGKMSFSRYALIALSKNDQYYNGPAKCFDIIYSFVGSNNINSIEIFSYGFNNFFNFTYDSIDEIGSNKIIYEGNIIIKNKQYKLIVKNTLQDVYPNDYLNRQAYITSCLVKSHSIDFSDLTEIAYYFRKLLQFVTFNTQKRFEKITFHTHYKQEYNLFINEKFNYKGAEKLYFVPFCCFNENPKELFDFIDTFFERPYSLYFDKKDGFHESQVPAIIGEFENVFKKTIAKSTNYKRYVSDCKKLIHFDEMIEMIKKFRIDRNIDAEDFTDIMSLIKSYSVSLEKKIDYTINEFCECLKFKTIDFGFGRTIVDFASVQSKVRKGISHGKKYNYDETKRSVYTIEIFQELIYFLVCKYIIKCSDYSLLKIFDCHYFKMINLENSVIKNNKISN